MLEIESIKYEKCEFKILDSISFKLDAGDMLQIAGDNGSGKSTLLKVIIGLLNATSGTIRWEGSQTNTNNIMLKNVLWIGHQSGMKMTLTAEENLKFYHPSTTRAARWQALEKVALGGYEDVPVAALSAGQQRRVALARLWLSDARLCVLDEPFTALDSTGCTLLAQQMLIHADRGGIVIFTTHQPVQFPHNRVQLLNLELH